MTAENCGGARTGPREPFADRLAFIGHAGSNDARGRVYFVRTDTEGPTDRRAITQPPEDTSWPSWNPNGGSLVYASWSSGRQSLFTVNVGLGGDVSAPRAVVRSVEPNRIDKHTSWGPDGLIAYHNLGRIWTIPFVGGTPTPRTPESIVATDPAWSSDGRLAFVEASPAGPTIRILARDLVTDVTPSGGIPGENPAWSPDGFLLAFGSGGDIFTRVVGTGEERLVVTNGEDPCFDPSGHQIAFVRDGRIWVVGRDGSAPRQMTDGPNDRHPTWSRLGG